MTYFINYQNQVLDQTSIKKTFRGCLKHVSLITISLLVGGQCLVGISPTSANPVPSHFLLAQRIVDGLPPPPAMPSGELPELPPAQPTPVQPAQPQVEVQPQQAQQPPTLAPTSSTIANQRYLVVVNGDSPLLLAQVRQVESGAFLQSYEGRQVIQAGAFNAADRAERQVVALQSQGIGAEVIRVAEPNSPQAIAPSSPQTVSYATPAQTPSPDLLPLTPVSREVVFGQEPNFQTAQAIPSSLAANARGYYVVIPGRRENLSAIDTRVRQLGGGLITTSVVSQRQAPLGSHVLVGPFTTRGAAERWNNYLQDYGLDSQVYFGR